MIFGVANKRSIAWACAEACAAQGAKLAFTYQGERLKENVEKLTARLDETLVVPCDVTNQAEVDAAFAAVGEKYGKLDFLIHSIAFAPREALEGEFVTTTREAFLTALEISAFSLTQVALGRAAADEGRRQHRHDELLRRGKGRHELQRDGRRKSRARSFDALSSRRSGQTQHSRQRHQRRTDQHALGARRQKYGLAALATSAKNRRSSATSKPAKSATPRFFSSATSHRQSPAKRSTSIAATISWEFRVCRKLQIVADSCRKLKKYRCLIF